MSCYDDAVIYVIKVNGELYVGSTNNYPKREKDHARFMNTNAPNLYETIRANDSKYEIEIYKEYPCDDRTELRKEEQRCMNELGGLDCLLNTINAWTDRVEYRIRLPLRNIERRIKRKYPNVIKNVMRKIKRLF